MMGFSVGRSVFDGIRRHDAASRAQQNAIIVMDLIVHDIALAGCGATGSGQPPITQALDNSVQVTSDLNTDGDTDDANERLTYALNADKNMLTRASGRGTPQPLLRDLAPNGLRLQYYDASGVAFTVGTDSGWLRQIAAVRVSLSVQVDSTPTTTLRLERTATLRNR